MISCSDNKICTFSLYQEQLECFLSCRITTFITEFLLLHLSAQLQTESFVFYSATFNQKSLKLSSLMFLCWGFVWFTDSVTVEIRGVILFFSCNRFDSSASDWLVSVRGGGTRSKAAVCQMRELWQVLKKTLIRGSLCAIFCLYMFYYN